MIKRRTALAMLAGTFLPTGALARFAPPDERGSSLVFMDLPPEAERLPSPPRMVAMEEYGLSDGRHGGTMRILISGQRDIRYMPINCYSRLVGYNRNMELEADLLESFEVENERAFTFRLRKGHRWSDGSAFTTEDFRYVWEDMFLNEELYRGGIPANLIVNDRPPRFEVVDEWTVRYVWDDPNPDFLTDIASPSPLRLMQPSAYLRQFHVQYQTEAMLVQHQTAERVEDWVALHQKMSRSVRPENPDLPTLDAWRNRTAPPAGRFVFERNPFYHRVDSSGRQLPYIDRIFLDVSSADLIAAKAGTGESDLQFANLDFADYTFLKRAEKRYPIKVDLWKRTQGSSIALIPNLNCKDPTWNAMWRDVRVRRALSLAVNREEINKAVFFGLAKESANSILPESPLFRPQYRSAWADFDPARANALLDEVGLTERDSYGVRILPDGRPAKLVIESAGEQSRESDVVELLHDHWMEIGIKLYIRVSQRELLRRRVKGGDTLMVVSQGLDNGVPTADMSPKELAPTADDQLQWPLWGLYEMSGGSDGRPADLPEAILLHEQLETWRRATSHEEREAAWHRMLETFTDQVFTIGTVNAALQPVVRSSRLRNVPTSGLYGYDPMSYMGVYLPDTFWYEGEA